MQLCYKYNFNAGFALTQQVKPGSPGRNCLYI